MKLKKFLFDKNIKKIDKIYYILLVAIRLTLLLAIIGAIYNFRWTVLFVSSLTLILTFLPNIFEKRYKINLPVEFEIIVIIFIYASLFLGEVHDYYTKYWWWDTILHAGSAIAFGFIGFTILYVLYRGGKIKASPIIIAIFSFCFALAIGAFWEIIEFAIDQIFNKNMQKSGLIDTMWDLILDSIGALIASIAGYFYLKGSKIFIFQNITNRFINENPDLFTINY